MICRRSPGLLWRQGSEFFCDLTATTDQPGLLDSVRMLIPDGIKDRSETGQRLTPTHAVKKGTRYRYYVSPVTVARFFSRETVGPLVALLLVKASPTTGA